MAWAGKTQIEIGMAVGRNQATVSKFFAAAKKAGVELPCNVYEVRRENHFAALANLAATASGAACRNPGMPRAAKKGKGKRT